MLCSFDFSTKW
uniref:Uncharacterized protein n=1 Tax=Rhizophora mucronata TaxID=61149 RepID=A0A2P2QLH1_RHIMU